MRAVQISLVCAVLLVSGVLTGTNHAVQALPAAGRDRLPVVATVDVTSRVGDETIVFTGWAELDREAPHDEGGVDVVDIEIVSMDLTGASAIGAITAVERPNSGQTYVSTGEIRSKQSGQDFPASSFFDVYVNVTLPAAPGGSMVIHNEAPLHVTPREGGPEVNIDAWPPLGVTYELDPIYGVDNDGDGPADEDTADDDNDGLIDEDPPGGGNSDTDDEFDEDPPISQCTLPVCDNDGDTQMDEDPSCVPLMNTGNVNNMKAGFCVRDITMEFPPELPSYSVARGGPSGLHPADILALTPPGVPGQPLSLVGCNDDFSGLGLQSQVPFTATAGETYRIQVGSWSGAAGGSLTLNVYATAGGSPVAVSGNDNLAGAWTIPSLPFIGQQSTIAATTEAGEPLNCSMGGHTVWYSYTPSSTGATTANTAGSSYDTVLAVYTGDGFAGGGGGQAPFVRVPCANLGLTADGCDDGGDGDQDDVDALSYGGDLSGGGTSEIYFSVGPGAQGAPGSAVEVQRNCPAPEPEPDEFGTSLNSTNFQMLDGNGPVGTCSAAFPLGFIEGASVRDDLDAVYGEAPQAVDTDNDGVPESPVYFSLDALSPSLGTLGFSSGDILKTAGGGAPTLYASATAMGLQSGDDLDAACLQESGDGAYGAGDVLFFSLAAGSPTLSGIGAGPGDLLAPGSPPTIAESAASLGLLGSDNVNALKCMAIKDADADTDGDTIPNGSDPDDDNDGCTDTQELGLDAGLGGLRNPHLFWDFYDTPNPSGNVRDRAVDIGDLFRVVGRFGAFTDPPPTKGEAFAEALSAPPPSGYHAAYDRSAPTGEPWDLGPPDGSIDVSDIFFAVVQFGHSCV